MVMCSVDGCGNPVNSRGWCKMHYSRWLRHGSAAKKLRFRRGEALRYFLANVLTYNGDDCLFWPFGNGRPSIHFDGHRHTMARVICERFHGPAPTPDSEAAHSCGNGRCIAKRHVRWATQKENQEDKERHGTQLRGAAHGMAKLSENDVRMILSLKGALTQRALARQFKVSQSLISDILLGKMWKCIPR